MRIIPNYGHMKITTPNLTPPPPKKKNKKTNTISIAHRQQKSGTQSQIYTVQKDAAI
jgi:hypothetical protein